MPIIILSSSSSSLSIVPPIYFSRSSRSRMSDIDRQTEIFLPIGSCITIVDITVTTYQNDAIDYRRERLVNETQWYRLIHPVRVESARGCMTVSWRQHHILFGVDVSEPLRQIFHHLVHYSQYFIQSILNRSSFVSVPIPIHTLPLPLCVVI